MKKVIVIIVAVLILVGGIFGAYKYIQIKHSKELSELHDLYENAQNQIDTLQIQNENLMNPPKIEVSVRTLKEYTAAASELITYKYYYTDAGTYEKNKTFGDSDIAIPFTTDKVVYTFSGVISAGIDVSDIKYVVDEKNSKIVVAMPKAKIIAHEMDEKSFQSYDVKKSVFTSSSLDNYAAFVGALKENQEAKLLEKNDFWKDVEGNRVLNYYSQMMLRSC